MLENLLKKAENLECRCYNKFQEQLKESDGKNPKIRYEEFIGKVNKLIDNERE